MAGQSLVITFNSAVDETALKCGDPFYKDFPKYIYQQAVYRAERSIAQEYKILDRIMTVINTAGTSPVSLVPTISLSTPQNFANHIWRLTVTPNEGAEQIYQQTTLDKVLDNLTVSTAAENFYYEVIYDTNAYKLYYTWPDASDTITIYHSAGIAGQEDYDTLDAEGNANVLPAIPNEYFEETVRRAVRYMVKLGIAKYETGEKAQRYNRLLSIYSRRGDESEDLSLGRDRAWIQIKPFQYP